MLTATSLDGYLASCAAIRAVDQWDSIAAIDRPTLAIAGTHDAPAPPTDGRRMARAIAGAQYVELDAAHISNVEATDRFNAEVMQFLKN
jgi:3-oxoadipate enol-lactonase